MNPFIILALIIFTCCVILYRILSKGRKEAEDNRRIYESEYQNPKKERL